MSSSPNDLLAERKFGSSHSAFTTPARQKRARVVTPDDGRVSPLLQGLAELAVLCDRSGARAPTNFVHIDQMMENDRAVEDITDASWLGPTNLYQNGTY